MNVELPVIVIIPVAVLSSLSVNEKLPVPVVAVRLLIVRVVIVPWSRNVSASVPGSFGSPSPNAFGDGACSGRACLCAIAAASCCSSIKKKQPFVAAAVYSPPTPSPLYDVTVYSPKYSVTETGVEVGVGETDGVGVGDGVALMLGVGDGVADAGEYCIASQTPLPLSVYVLPVTTPVDTMLVKIPAVTTGAEQDVTPTPVGVGDGDGDPAGLTDGVGEAVPGADEAFGTVFPVPPEPLHWASATLSAHNAARASLETPTRGQRGREGCISIAGMAVSIRKPSAARQNARRVYATETLFYLVERTPRRVRAAVGVAIDGTGKI